MSDRDPNAESLRLPRAIVGPVQAFLRTESAGGILLIAATAAALLWGTRRSEAPTASSGGRAPASICVLSIHESLHLWVNDALMAVFFFVVGLEIKRELVYGELAGVRKATLPIAGALGGMLVPAAIFLALNFGGDTEHGWGIAMATDIAFAVGVLTLAGTSVPQSLKVFLLALAIVDDIGAIVVIAVFYTESLDVVWLAGVVALLALVVALTNFEVRHMVVYAVLAAAVWLCVFESGVHATIAGVALGLLTPARPFKSSAHDSRPISERLETALHPWTSFAIVPIFALANAGVGLDGRLAPRCRIVARDARRGAGPGRGKAARDHVAHVVRCPPAHVGSPRRRALGATGGRGAARRHRVYGRAVHQRPRILGSAVGR